MAIKLKDSDFYLRFHEDELLNNLFEIYYLTNVNNLKGCKIEEQEIKIKECEKEVCRCLHDIPNIKRIFRKPRKITQKEFLNRTWFKFRKSLKKIYFENLKNKDFNEVKLSYDNYYNFVKKYYYWLSKELPIIGMVCCKDVVNKLEELRKELY